jgi:hypothetical protein
MKALIINYNRLTLPQKLAAWLAATGCEPIIIDNNSDYPPLLDWYLNAPYRILAMDANYGHRVVWTTDVLRQLGIGPQERYLVTDSDLDCDGVPYDFVDVLSAGLDKYPHVPKCGLSLEINDLPYTQSAQYVRNRCELRYWTKPLDAMYFDAPVDTTLALYREGWATYALEAIRTNRPYTARHVPWYYTDLASLPEDEQYYFNTANESSSGKKRLVP